MQHTPAPETFVETLERLGLADLLDAFIAPERVRRIGFNDLEFFAREHGYCFVREGGNVYGKLMLVPVEPASPAPVLRLVTRSDVAAVHPSRRAA